MLVVQREQEMLEQVREGIWNAPGTTAGEKEQLILALPEAMADEFRDIYIDAAKDRELSFTARMQAITMLGRLTHPDVAAALKECAEDEPVPDIRGVARTALEAVEARLEEAGAAPEATEEQAPAGEAPVLDATTPPPTPEQPGQSSAAVADEAP